MVGTRFRDTRMNRNLSLNEVATRAAISVATLSRIERDKQGLNLGLFLVLCRILRVSPQEVLGSEPQDQDSLASQIQTLQHEERLQLWRDLAERRRNGRHRGARVQMHRLTEELEELLAQFEFVRAEVESVHARVRRK